MRIQKLVDNIKTLVRFNYIMKAVILDYALSDFRAI